MSADSYAVCPKCGNPEQENEGTGTVREDYELGIYQGVFFIDYHGKCRECGYTKEFKHEEILTPKEET